MVTDCLCFIRCLFLRIGGTPLMDLVSIDGLATDATFTEAIRWAHEVESTATSFSS